MQISVFSAQMSMQMTVLQAGPVGDRAGATAMPGDDHRPGRVDWGDGGSGGFYDDPRRGQGRIGHHRQHSAAGTRTDLTAAASSFVNNALAGGEDGLRSVIAAAGLALDPELSLDNLPEDPIWDALPENLKKAVTAFVRARESAAALTALAQGGDAAAEVSRADRRGLIRQAVADQVDLKIAVLRAADATDSDVALADQWHIGGDRQIEKVLQYIRDLGEDSDLQSTRRKMIRTMLRDIRHGAVAEASLPVPGPAGDPPVITIAPRSNAAERYQLAAFSLSVSFNFSTLSVTS